MIDPTSMPEAARPHIVDELIEDRAPRLIDTPIWPLVKAVGYPMLGYRRAVAMADAIAALSGTGCFECDCHSMAVIPVSAKKTTTTAAIDSFRERLAFRPYFTT